MNMKIGELIDIQPGVTPQDITTDRTSSYYSMQGIGRVLAQLTTATVAATKKATVQLMQAKDDIGTGAKALTEPVEATAGTGGEAIFLQVEAQAGEMDIANGFTHVAVKVTCDHDSAVQGAALLIFGERSFKP